MGEDHGFSFGFFEVCSAFETPPKNCLEKGSGLEMHVSVPFADQCGRVTDDRAKRQGV